MPARRPAPSRSGSSSLCLFLLTCPDPFGYSFSIILKEMQKASDSAPALASFSLDALPVINHFLEPLDLSTVLEAYLPPPHPRRRVPPVQAIGLLLRNLLLSRDRKSTRLNSSHQIISYAVFCLKT